MSGVEPIKNEICLHSLSTFKKLVHISQLVRKSCSVPGCTLAGSFAESGSRWVCRCSSRQAIVIVHASAALSDAYRVFFFFFSFFLSVRAVNAPRENGNHLTHTKENRI